MARDFFKAAKDAHGSAPQFGKAEKTKTKKSPKGTKAPPPKSGDEKFEAWENKVKRKVGDRKPMANKFLPFIVEKSTPPHIYQTLLSRSKGMNTALITSVFYLVLHKGIKEIRTHVKTLPDMQLEALYEELLNHWQEARIPEEDLQIFLGLSNYITSDETDKWDEALSEFSHNDIMAFFLVVCKCGISDNFTDLDFHNIFLQGTREGALNDIGKHKLFSDKASKMMFENPFELKCYILYQIFLRKGEPIPCVQAEFTVPGTQGGD